MHSHEIFGCISPIRARQHSIHLQFFVPALCTHQFAAAHRAFLMLSLLLPRNSPPPLSWPSSTASLPTSACDPHRVPIATLLFSNFLPPTPSLLLTLLLFSIPLRMLPPPPVPLNAPIAVARLHVAHVVTGLSGGISKQSSALLQNAFVKAACLLNASSLTAVALIC